MEERKLEEVTNLPNGRPQSEQARKHDGEKTSLMFVLSTELKDAVDASALRLNISRSQFIREALAEKAGYDLSQDRGVQVGHSRKYASPEARKAAGKERNRIRRELIKKLLSSADNAERQEEIQGLIDSLKEGN